MTSEKCDKLFQIFFERFANDHSKYLIPRMPYFDQQEQRRIIDFAIISHGMQGTGPKVAILLYPPERERTAAQQRDIIRCCRALREQDWEPVVFSAEDLEYRPRHVKATLDDLFCPKRKQAGNKGNPSRLAVWLQEFIPFFNQRLVKNVDVLIFASMFVAVFIFNFLVSLQHPPQSTHRYTRLKPRTEKVFVMVNADEQADTQFTIRHQEPPEPGEAELIEYDGQIIPVINLDNPMPFVPHEAPGQPEEGIQDPLYVATIRYCISGVTCVLKNNEAIQLWGVQLPPAPAQQSMALVSLNEMAAGKKIQIEVRKREAGHMVVKATLGKQDLAQAQVSKGLLLPDAEGDIYHAPSKPRQRKTNPPIGTDRVSWMNESESLASSAH